MSLFVTKVGDTGRPLILSLGFDLTGCTVALYATRNGATKIDGAACTILTPGVTLPDGGAAAVGDVQFDPADADVDTEGAYRVTCVVALPSDKPVSVPADDAPAEAYIYWRIDPR